MPTSSRGARALSDLVAEALSNREIAQRLVLSERTVEAHVRSILGKLVSPAARKFVMWLLGAQR